MEYRSDTTALPPVAFEEAERALASVETCATQQHMDQLMLNTRDAKQLDDYFYSTSSRQLAYHFLHHPKLYTQSMIWKESEHSLGGRPGVDRRLTICVMHPDAYDILCRFFYQAQQMRDQIDAKILKD